MKKVLLINPPFYRLLGSHYNANSLGLAYIAAALNAEGHDAWIYNADYLPNNIYVDLKSIMGNFESYKQFFVENHPLWEEVIDRISEFQPDWIGYTCYTANLKAIDIISTLVKKKMPNVRQVVGGVHPTLDRDVLTKLPFMDYAVRREGEATMLSLVNGNNKVPGIVTRENSSTAVDSTPLENIEDLLPERNKFWKVDDLTTMDVSYVCTIRGCPYRCSYCASPFHWKRNLTKYRTPASVLRELHVLKNDHWHTGDRYDYSASANTKAKSELLIKENTIVYFVDDIFTMKKKRVIEILQGMIDEGLDMPWKCELRADSLDDEICEMMAKAGCVRAKVGFETGSDRLLKMIQKDETKSQMKKGAALLREHGIPFTAYFMTGFPEETDDDLRETIQFAKDIEADYYSLSILAPYYGTKMYYDLVDSGHELEKKPWEYFYQQTGELIVNTTLSSEVMAEYIALNDGKGYI